MMQSQKHRPRVTKGKKKVSFAKCESVTERISRVIKEDQNLVERIAAWQRSLQEEGRGDS